jgi:hypothetical protein
MTQTFTEAFSSVLETVPLLPGTWHPGTKRMQYFPAHARKDHGLVLETTWRKK